MYLSLLAVGIVTLLVFLFSIVWNLRQVMQGKRTVRNVFIFHTYLVIVCVGTISVGVVTTFFGLFNLLIASIFGVLQIGGSFVLIHHLDQWDANTFYWENIYILGYGESHVIA